jgi:hypothetical protein
MTAFTAVLAIALLMTSSVTFAQGTATGPITVHDVEPGPIVHIGDAINPIPIDLDPLGPPWNKSIRDPKGYVVGVTMVDIVETILNVGTEPWGDWHENLLLPPFGLPPSTWQNVVGLWVNGNPIGFSAMGLGTQGLWLNGFSQPVLSGDILTIHKQVLADGSVDANGGPLIRMQEYPTPAVPEPGTLLLLAVSTLVLVAMRQHW